LWLSTLGIVFLAIHAGRMPLTDDMLGRISPICCQRSETF